MKTYQEFVQEWNGKQVTRFGGECVSLIAEYESENGLPIVWGDAHQWANNPTMASAYDWVQNNPADPNQLPPQGAIIIWPLPNEHIAFFDHNLGNHQFMSFGQNSGGPQAHFQPHSWEHVVGWWVPKHAATPAPYAISAIEPVQIHVQANRNKWNLAQPDFNAVVANPIISSGPGVDFTAHATLTRSDQGFAGYSYYLEDANTPHGWNALDCTVIQQQPMPKPYVAPTGAVNVPTNTDPYHLVIDVPGYTTANNAVNDIPKGGVVRVPNGQYMKFTEKFGMINVTQVQGKPGSWINPSDNVIPPPPPPEPPKSKPYLGPREPSPPEVAEVIPVTVEPKPKPQRVNSNGILTNAEKESFRSFNKDRQPVTFIMEFGYPFTDLSGNTNKIVQRDLFDEVEFAGTFLHQGVEWARVHVPDANGNLAINRWYAVPVLNPITHTPYITPHDVTYNTKTTTPERIALKHPTPFDRFIEFGTTVDILYDKAMRTIDGVFQKKHKSKQK